MINGNRSNNNMISLLVPLRGDKMISLLVPLRGDNWILLAHRPKCTVTLNSN